jgi:oxaloacetate decarboxylase alpha subunit
VALNLRSMGYTAPFHEPAARSVEEKLTTIAARERFPAGRPVEHDRGQYAHQVPGGMLTNLRHQLRLVGLDHQYDASLEECARVRQEWGYPIMVTPLSQFVGTQAAINVIVGERYREVTDQTIQYALGRWGGDEAIDAMDPDIRDRILSHPRVRELENWEPPTATLDEIRGQFGAPGVSDEEMLLRIEVLDQEIAAMRAAGPPRDYLSAEQPLVQLVSELTRRSDRGFIHLERKDLSLTLAREMPE